MTKMFKKTMLAAALATVSGGAFAAAEVATTPVGISIEASQSASAISANNIEIKLGAEYAVGDIITLSVTGQAAVADSWKNTITVLAVDESVDPVTGVGLNDGTKGLVLGKLNGTTSGATYRVTQVVDGAGTPTTVGATVLVDGLELRRNQAVAAGVVNVSFSAQTQTGVAIDTTGTKLTAPLSAAGQELFNKFDFGGANASRLGQNGNKRIAIEFSRRAFTTGNARDTFIPGLVQQGGTFLSARDTVGIAFKQGVGVDLVTYTLNGDFSWVPDLSKPETSIFVSAGCALDKDELTASKVVFTRAGAGDCTLTLDLADGLGNVAPVAIEPQAFTYSMVVDYTDAGANYDGVAGQERSVTLADNANAGTWLLNSFNTTIGYMPYGDGISQIIYLANTGTVVGDVFVDVWSENGTRLLTNKKVGTTAANNQTLLSGAIRSALADLGVTNDRVRIRVVADIPASNGRVFSAYNVNGDRLFTPNN